MPSINHEGSRGKTKHSIALFHNYYSTRAGEEIVLQTECELLRSAGHDVSVCSLDSAAVKWHQLPTVALGTVWSERGYSLVRDHLWRSGAKIAHFHNTFPLLSPASYYAAAELGIPVVQTLHNYRLLCINATLFRDGSVCDDCIGRTVPMRSILRRCYHNSFVSSGVVAAMLSFHNALATFKTKISVYVALTPFAKSVFVQGGLPEDRIVVKPNCLGADPGVGRHEGRFALFVGRLTPEKGISTLLAAWKGLAGDLPLYIVGDGPLKKAVLDCPWAVYLGPLSRQGVLDLMQEALCLVFPSEWYEGLPMTIVEAFACGLPVLAANIGAAACMISDRRDGILFEPGAAGQLQCFVRMLDRSSELRRSIGTNARKTYEAGYTANATLGALESIYNGVAM